MCISTERFLFIGFVDHGSSWPVKDRLTVGGVVLEGKPSCSVVHALVDGKTVGFVSAKLNINVSQFVFFPQRKGESDVTVICDLQWGGMPAGKIIGVVEVSEVR